MEKKWKKAKWLSGETLQIAENRRKAKRQRKKERYTHLNAQFQRLARRNKKAFLSDRCKEIEKTIEWERLEISSRKLEIPNGTFHAKMGAIKDRNGRDLVEGKHVKKRWQEHTEELYRKEPHNPDNHNGVITHLDPDILEFEAKCGP